MTYWNFGTQKLFRSLDKAAKHAVDNDLTPSQLEVLEHGQSHQADRHDRADLAVYMRGHSTFEMEPNP